MNLNLKKNNTILAQNPEEDSVYLFRLDEEELVVPDEEEFDRVSAYYQDELVRTKNNKIEDFSKYY